MLCLDTNVVIGILNGRPEPVRRNLAAALAAGEQVTVSSIVLFELWYGAAKSGRPAENAERIRTFLSGQIEVLPFEQEDAREAGQLRAALEKAGTPIGPFDVLIAGQALRWQAPIVTANAGEFDRIPGLTRLDWSRERNG
ncbi:type II toxin-antitoxin system VapC family toxin [Inquilinus limosus]|uniref:Ribonuclease VapC n=1 Tax=Inquilinus limosus TaxID=171674 RepID=A0A211ZPF3_9PROT|nr:type II toxin-antitoxin system VapC family toxin [Inquilinus limosus]OWJ67152.1 VapC toxin family PIN domain ribonuclease [Inquilinus limosus]